ncbi:MAG: T9SS type A sorting domain-containing protein [Saprospiraceae bacterium]
MAYRSFLPFLFSCSLLSSLAGQSAWERLPGPAGGLPAKVYVGAGSGELYAIGWQGDVFRSVDNGQSWQRTAEPDLCADLNLFDTYALGPDELWYRQSGAGYFVSADSLRSWQPTTTMPAQYYLDRDTSSGGTWISQVNGQGLLRSVDHGTNWDTVAWSNFNIYRNLQYDPPTNAFFVRAGQEFNRSTDEGLSWENIAPTFNPNEEHLVQYQLGADHQLYTLTDSLWVVWDSAAYHYEHRVKIYRSTAGGAYWTSHLLPDLGQNVFYDALAVLPGGRLFLFASQYQGQTYYYSDDHGASWSPVNTATWDPDVGLIVLPDGVLIGHRYPVGAYRSTDAGETWNLITDNLPFAGTADLVYFGADTLLAAQSEGVFRSTDGGLHWTLTFSRSIFSMKAKAGQIYLLGAKIWHSSDLGTSFQPVPLPANGYYLNYLPHSSGWLFLVVADSIYRSADFGAHWENLGTTPSFNPILAEFPDGTLVYGNEFEYYRSTDLGVNWTTMNVPGNVKAFTIGADGTAYGYLKYPTQALIWSNDQGASWQISTKPPAEKLFVSQTGTLIAYGSAACNHYWTSDNQGGNWDSLPSPVTPGFFGQDLTGRLLISRLGQGLWRTYETVDVTSSAPAAVHWQISPNPVFQYTELRLNETFPQAGWWEIFNSQGRMVARIPVTGPVTAWSRDGLPAGFYFFRVQMGPKTLATGKLVLSNQ